MNRADPLVPLSPHVAKRPSTLRVQGGGSKYRVESWDHGTTPRKQALLGRSIMGPSWDHGTGDFRFGLSVLGRLWSFDPAPSPITLHPQFSTTADRGIMGPRPCGPRDGEGGSSPWGVSPETDVKPYANTLATPVRAGSSGCPPFAISAILPRPRLLPLPRHPLAHSRPVESLHARPETLA